MPTAPDTVIPTGLPSAPSAPVAASAGGLPSAPTAPVAAAAGGLPSAPSAPVAASAGGLPSAPSNPAEITLLGHPGMDGVIVGGTIPVELHGFYVRMWDIDGILDRYERGDYYLERDSSYGFWAFYGPEEEGGAA
jgi:hypothetical protein